MYVCMCIMFHELCLQNVNANVSKVETGRRSEMRRGIFTSREKSKIQMKEEKKISKKAILLITTENLK